MDEISRIFDGIHLLGDEIVRLNEVVIASQLSRQVGDRLQPQRREIGAQRLRVTHRHRRRRLENALLDKSWIMNLPRALVFTLSLLTNSS